MWWRMGLLFFGVMCVGIPLAWGIGYLLDLRLSGHIDANALGILKFLEGVIVGGLVAKISLDFFDDWVFGDRF